MAEIGLIAPVVGVAGAGIKLSTTLYTFAETVAGHDRLERSPEGAAIGHGQPQARGRAGQALEVAADCEGMTTRHLQGLEHAIARDEGMVEGRDSGLVLVPQPVPDPDLHRSRAYDPGVDEP